jgi:prepilin-type processing-associated H-X9-DG protein
LSNVKQLAMGQLMYGADHDDGLPLAENWMDAIPQYVRDKDCFHCPAIPEGGGYGYAMNVEMSGKRTSREPEPAAEVLLFESVLLARNACSGVYGFPDPPRHDGKNCFAYLDGHVKAHRPEEKP